MDMAEAIKLLEQQILNPTQGLPDEIFYFISRTTPLVNVDLLIKNEQNQTLLTWRDDSFGSPGWHVPGGIIRYKETLAARIEAVAKNELGTKVEFNYPPIAVNECIMKDRVNRAHFISLLFHCKLISPLDEKLKCTGDLPFANQWCWHDTCPDNIIEVHDELYKRYI
ncbi:hypothetical protein A2291_07350 [candidate division WOR-1 bacterium RIFOXYB2_FULL_42_35]|uniref:Nudix hydrolase domain-containing protein n=1 Tax=candidate division WOR-1 bacterium RIFOXYC2_FULL_41_25 TaxID=1802586 RepID=A0A1F4TKK4_UNCSA|nr:MAG: hypothetical protein A2291_07350 [candidate division WOR-1 bacterium RIFOXYB2_FULL_42_35]OGC25582.1 MAG: hypothetical protein A2247_01540 [candidate division WOR-1 bacterium RIFOXYA2_FULL_41_14]OGC33258.1 MAG: hypothetical protein A2462_07525 [candidate division WOR-1 bacterium RIFOXYC2_FULL_41_25]OGC41367.1 MAG: hypothetical protein A2548_02465 [candidate division WOR-1 bacterium RIFOXYD2_FULL_41_8]